MKLKLALATPPLDASVSPLGETACEGVEITTLAELELRVAAIGPTLGQRSAEQTGRSARSVCQRGLLELPWLVRLACIELAESWLGQSFAFQFQS